MKSLIGYFDFLLKKMPESLLNYIFTFTPYIVNSAV